MASHLFRSFGRRRARKLRPYSQQAYDEKLEGVRLTLEKPIFEVTPSEIWLEIGFGGGEHLLAQLTQNPHIHMIGCEPFVNGIAKLLGHLADEDRERVRIWPDDVRSLLEKIPPHYFSKAFILFPDPWPKKRQHKRRLIQREFINNLLQTLKKGALLHIASDDQAYIEHILDFLPHHPDITYVQGPSSADSSTWGRRPEGWPPTRYEEKALLKGLSCAYMIFQKN